MSLKNIIVHSSVYHGNLSLDEDTVLEAERCLKELHRGHLGKKLTIRNKLVRVELGTPTELTLVRDAKLDAFGVRIVFTRELEFYDMFGRKLIMTDSLLEEIIGYYELYTNIMQRLRA